jgi:3-polyprenyl-4-hydroxybenzoate decarboxylase
MARHLIGMTGASGAILGVDFVQRCPGEKHVLLSETGLKAADLEPHVRWIFDDDDLAAPFSSGRRSRPRSASSGPCSSRSPRRSCSWTRA